MKSVRGPATTIRRVAPGSLTLELDTEDVGLGAVL